MTRYALWILAWSLITGSIAMKQLGVVYGLWITVFCFILPMLLLACPDNKPTNGSETKPNKPN